MLMRRFLTLFVFSCGLCLVAAAPRATPTPRPATPSPAATMHLNLPSLSPTVLIYPFDAASGLQQKVGVQVATIFSHAMTQAGNVNVLPIPTGVQRANFLTTARADKADYYITGYITPIGSSASVVVQVVSVQSGVIAFAQTNQVTNINDAISLALTAHDAIVQLAGVSVDVTTTESATAAPSTEPTNGASFSLTHLFAGKHGHGTIASATTAPSTKPQRGVILIAVHGRDVAADDLTHATLALEHDLAARFTVRNGGAAPANIQTAADSICGSDRDNTIATGTLVQHRVGGIRPRVDSVFTLQVWTCFGDVLYETTESNLDVAKAISTAVADYVTAHPSNG
jgi:hypothetical protein